MPPKKGQMVTPATHQGSQELAREAAEIDAQGVDAEYETPTPKPQLNEDMIKTIQQMQKQLDEQESCHQAQMAELEQQVQGSDRIQQQPSDGSSDMPIADLVKWFKSNSTHDMIQLRRKSHELYEDQSIIGKTMDSNWLAERTLHNGNRLFFEMLSILTHMTYTSDTCHHTNRSRSLMEEAWMKPSRT